MSNTYSPTADLTAKQKPSGAGHGDHRIMMLCGHKPASKTGAVYRRGIGWIRRAACNTAKEKA
jgi:hypothetical protein